MLMSGIIYEFVTKDGLIFDSGKWGIQHISTKIESQTFKISLTFIKYDREKKYYPVELESFIKGGIGNSFTKVNNTDFEIRIKRVILNTDLTQRLIVEIIKPMNDNDISKCLNCNNNKIIYTYVDDINTKSFCSKKCLNLYFGPKRPLDEPPEDEPKSKKQKIIEKENIDILLIGLDHGDKERLLNNNLVKSLNKYSEYFNKEPILVKQPSNEYNITRRKPFLIFWESTYLENENILVKDINGFDSKSWNLPCEDEIISSFQFLETAYFLFLFPVDYNNENQILKYLEGQDNTKAINIQKNLIAKHGIKTIDIKQYGLKNPAALRVGFVFLKRLINAIIQTGELNLKYMETIIPNTKQCEKIINDVKEIIFKIISLEVKKKQAEDILNDKIKNFGGDYTFVYNMIVPQTIDDVFKNNNHLFLMNIISENGELYNYYEIIKTFIIKIWTIISSNVNPDLIEYNKLHFFVDDNNKNIEIINNQYFRSILEQLKTDETISIPTLIYTKLIRLCNDGFLLSYKNYKDVKNDSPFLQLRNIIFFQNMTNICLSTNIKRCIVFSGDAHIKGINEIIKNQYILDYSIDIYNIRTVKDNELFSDIVQNLFSEDTKLFLKEIRNKILLYLFYEKIDKWLWKTEQFKDKISFKRPEGKLFIINPIKEEYEILLIDEKDKKGKKIKRFIKERPKFQLMVGLTEYFLNSRPDDVNFRDEEYYTIGYYIYCIITEISPTFNYMINNYNNQYDQEITDTIRKFKEKIYSFKLFPFSSSVVRDRKIGENITFPYIKPGEKFNVYDKIQQKIKDDNEPI